MRAIPLLAVLLMFLIGVPSAQAGPVVNRAASALSSDPVYVAPDARPSVTSAEAAMLRSDIAKDHSGPTYIAILPASAGNEEGGDPTAVALAIGRALGSGTVAVVVGGEFRAVSSVLPRGDAAALSRQAFQAHRSQGIAVTVGDFLRRVGGVLSSRAGGQSPSPGGQGAGGSSAAAPALLGLLVLGAAGYMFFRSRQRRRREAVELTEVREHAREDLIALGDDIRALDLDVQMPDVDPRVREDYGRAVDAYQAADRDLQRARRPADLGRVTTDLEEGRYAMVSTRARLEGRQPPERRAPCFFDPRHGPSVRDVQWAPPGGAPRPVPTCAADAVRIEAGEDPHPRMINVGGVNDRTGMLRRITAPGRGDTSAVTEAWAGVACSRVSWPAHCLAARLATGWAQRWARATATGTMATAATLAVAGAGATSVAGAGATSVAGTVATSVAGAGATSAVEAVEAVATSSRIWIRHTAYPSAVVAAPCPLRTG